VGEGDALVEALLGADLHDEPCRPGGAAQLLALLDGHTHRLLHQDVLAGLEGPEGHGYVKLVGDSDDDRVHVRVGEHRVVVRVGLPRSVHGRHPLQQILRHVADGEELGVLRLAAGFEVGSLRDLARSQDPDPKRSLFPTHATRILPVEYPRHENSGERQNQEPYPEGPLHAPAGPGAASAPPV
jgi:hypothetical protein